MSKIFFLQKSKADQLIEVREEGADTWWNKIPQSTQKYIRQKAQSEMAEHREQIPNDPGSKHVYEVTAETRQIIVSPWWDDDHDPERYLKEKNAAYYNPETGNRIEKESHGDSERK